MDEENEREEEVEGGAEGTGQEQPQTGGWANPQEGATVVAVETGRNKSVNVPVGAPFQVTVERIAEQARYGGYFRVFLNGEEIVNVEEAPATIEAGMRIAVTSYDKVG